jgi:hypothetical protein
LDGAKVQRNAGVPSRGAEPGRERGHDGQRPLALLYIAMDPPLPPPHFLWREGLASFEYFKSFFWFLDF